MGRIGKVGVVLVVTGIALLFVEWFFQPPARVEGLTISTMTLSTAPFVREARKSEPIGLICSAEMTLRLPSICDWTKCALPKKVEALRPGDKVVVWRDGIVAWQIKSEQDDVYGFSEAVAAYSKSQSRGYSIAAVLVAFGLIFVAFDRRKNAL